MKIGIGTKFIRRDNKRRDIETVIDIYETFSKASGERVKRRFVCEHIFFGQKFIGLKMEMKNKFQINIPFGEANFN